MDRTEPTTLTNMCMLTNDNRILTIDRIDPGWPGITFPGGHVEIHESFHDAMVREFKEETGLTLENPKLVGIKQFYDDDDHRYLVLFYRASKFHGQLNSSEEGELKWLTKDQLLNSKLAYNFNHDLPVFFNEEITEHFFYQTDNELF